ncbi:unnamed protein product [Gongylonema pulchrum]|uniref:VPS9 domain-containing protein n=1 Tax=Gongylonema pulchrum TaxID=637853 RepID=A0A183E506_9BILA|nr:unnamed protein product [Gongylonema pulchrum]
MSQILPTGISTELTTARNIAKTHDRAGSPGAASTWYANESTSNVTSYTKDEVKAMLRTILEETYVRLSGYIFKQIQSGPMGGNASPDIADLTLSVIQYLFLRKNPEFHFHLPIYRRYLRRLC